MATLIQIDQKFDGQRLDKFVLDQFPKASFGLIQKLCRKGQIRVDGGRVKGNRRLKVGEELRLPPHFGEEEVKQKEAVLQLSKKDEDMLAHWQVYEDDAVHIINKPYGLPSQAGTNHKRSVDRLLIAANPEQTPRLVHRLDKDTTGCLVLAKTRAEATRLTTLFKTRDVQKIYLALVRGRLSQKQGKIALPLTKGEHGVFVDEAEGKNALSFYQVLVSAGDIHLVAVKPKTGRMHQIRVHMAAAGAPLVGDLKYDGAPLESEGLAVDKKMFLHAWQVHFENVAAKAELPSHFKQVMDYFSWHEAHLQSVIADSGFLDI